MTGTQPEPAAGGKPSAGDTSPPLPHPQRQGAFAIISLVVGMAAVVIAALVVNNARHLAAGLLIIAALALIVLWIFGHTTSRWYSPALTVILVAFLAAAAWHLYAVPAAHAKIHTAPGPVKAPKLYFLQGRSATVPWCATYTVQSTSAVPTGYQVVMFDASTDDKGNVTSHYSYDQQAKPTGAVPGQYEDKDLFIGARSAPVGYPAVVVAYVIKDSEAAVLNDIGAYKNEWGLSEPPASLAMATLQVTRNGDRAYCPGFRP